MRKLIYFLLAISFNLYGITKNEIRFAVDHSIYDFLSENEQKIIDLKNATSDSLYFSALESLYSSRKDTFRLAQIIFEKSIKSKNIKYTYQLCQLHHKTNDKEIKDFTKALLLESQKESFIDSTESYCLDYYINEFTGTYQDTILMNQTKFNYIHEKWVENKLYSIINKSHSDSLTLEEIKSFYDKYAKSKFKYEALNILLNTYIKQKKFDDLAKFLITLLNNKLDGAESFIISRILMSPVLRETYDNGLQSSVFLTQAEKLLYDAIMADFYSFQLNFKTWDYAYFKNYCHLEIAKNAYFRLLLKNNSSYKISPVLINKEDKKLLKDAISFLSEISFHNNDYGELAEYHFWFGKILFLELDQRIHAASHFIDALNYGFENSSLDSESYDYLKRIYKDLKVTQDFWTWIRQLKNFSGPTFEDITQVTNLTNTKGRQIAIYDLNNDFYSDILIDGTKLFLNQKNKTFENYSNSAGITNNYTGLGYFVDFNNDNNTDIIFLSKDPKNSIDLLYKNMGNTKFVNVNDRAGDINEGLIRSSLALVDNDHNQIPELFLTNFTDLLDMNLSHWIIKDKFLYDYTEKIENSHSAFTKGCSVIDFDNDGIQEIYLSNYYSNKNQLFDHENGKYLDKASLLTLRDKNTSGFYSNSTSSTWGDIDNDGDFDLIIVNMVFKEYRNKFNSTRILRNDGDATFNLNGKTILYTKFTDITKDSGIQFHEYLAEANLFDADNDSDLDLLFTNYNKEAKPVFYENNGKGQFSNITFLSGINCNDTWSSCAFDYDNDNDLDLIISSNNGIKFYKNTHNKNKAKKIKIIENETKLDILDYDQLNSIDNVIYPNKQILGCRVVLTLKDAKGTKKIIRETSIGRGLGAQDDYNLHFGIGNATPIKIELYYNNELIKEKYFN